MVNEEVVLSNQPINHVATVCVCVCVCVGRGSGGNILKGWGSYRIRSKAL